MTQENPTRSASIAERASTISAMNSHGDLREIPLDQLQPHPQNPRLRVREDLVAQIAVEIKRSGFTYDHALLVRQMELDVYQIIGGHHRFEAAKQAGVKVVPSWIREMNDDEAFMQLILDNTQGEMSPLEEGHHVAEFVERGEVGGRGKKGGLREYARRVGKDPEGLRQKSKAYQVYESAYDVGGLDLSGLADSGSYKALYEISKAPEETWEALVGAMVDGKWDVATTAKEVKKVHGLEIPEEFKFWLPLGPLVEALLHRVPPPDPKGLVREARHVFSVIADEGSDEDEADYRSWLEAGINGKAWKKEEHGKWIAELLLRIADRIDRIEKADAVEWLKSMEPRSVDLLVTDPPYSTDLDDVEAFAASWVPLALSRIKEDGRAYICIGAYPEELHAYLGLALSSGWKVDVPLIWTYRNTLGQHPKGRYNLNYQVILHLYGPKSGDLNETQTSSRWTVWDITAPDGRHNTRVHGWQKPDELARRLVTHGSNAGEKVIDPFAGTGTFVRIATQLGRDGRGCDSDPKMIKLAKEQWQKKEDD